MSGDNKEGWQEEKHFSQRVYHYISGTFSLCGKLGFYTGELTPDNPQKRGRTDCTTCIKKLDKRKTQQPRAAGERAVK